MPKSKKINMSTKSFQERFDYGMSSTQCDSDPDIGKRELNLDACIVCEISDKWVSRCSGIDCHLSFHDQCLNTELGCGNEEDHRNPFCPYCWFKFVAMKSNPLREKAIKAKKAVLKYLDKDENGVQDHSVKSNTDIISDNDALQREKDTYSSKEEQINKVIDDEVEASEEEEMVARENIQVSEDHQTNVNTGASQVLSMQEHDQVQQNEKQIRRRRRLVEFNATDSEISSNESTEKITSSAQVVSMKKERKLSEAAKSNTVRHMSFYSKNQKRRLLWTPEEEEMLKIGVEKFSVEGKKNMPWRKILEMGQEVFNETRTPSDLKDKWRNMIGKSRAKNQQYPSLCN